MVEGLGVLRFEGGGYGTEDFARIHLAFPTAGVDGDAEVEGLVEVDAGEGFDFAEHDGEEAAADGDLGGAAAYFFPDGGAAAVGGI